MASGRQLKKAHAKHELSGGGQRIDIERQSSASKVHLRLTVTYHWQRQAAAYTGDERWPIAEEVRGVPVGRRTATSRMTDISCEPAYGSRKSLFRRPAGRSSIWEQLKLRVEIENCVGFWRRRLALVACDTKCRCIFVLGARNDRADDDDGLRWRTTLANEAASGLCRCWPQMTADESTPERRRRLSRSSRLARSLGRDDDRP